MRTIQVTLTVAVNDPDNGEHWTAEQFADLFVVDIVSSNDDPGEDCPTVMYAHVIEAKDVD